VTDRIVAKLESGVVPWRRPWGEYAAPQNLASKRAYRGVNVFLLSAMGFESPYWLTYRQAQERGGNVRKGERATPVVFWKTWERDETDDAGEVCKRRIPVLRYYNVFNVAQCDGIEAPPAPPVSRPFAPLAECERMVEAPDEQAVLARIREWRAAGDTLRDIAAKLTAEGVPSKQGNAEWSHQAVGKIVSRMNAITA
jgi:antirestriction protein ArdC